MRPQFHFRPSPNGFHAWDVHRLVRLSSGLAVEPIALEAIRELDEPYWFDAGVAPTCRKIAEHHVLIQQADLHFPIILCAEGRVMDGMHRVTRALIEGHRTIDGVRFTQTPEPDFTDIDPSGIFALSGRDAP